MKRILSIALMLFLLISAVSLSVFAADENVQVFVTISDSSGKIVVAQEAVTVTDADGDGGLTVSDALYAAHAAKYAGGAAAGYATETTEWGMSLTKLWGEENGGSYGYYLNDAMAWSLADPVSEGDYVNAYVYQDLTAWSDTYSYFDKRTAEAEAGGTLELTLLSAAFDENYAPITVPVAGAVITVNGETTAFVTDAQGRVTVTLDAAGDAVLSAKSEALTLVPPICRVTVAAAEAEETTAADTTAAETTAADTTAPADTGNTSAQTGDNAMAYICIALAAAAVILVCLRRRNAYEK